MKIKEIIVVEGRDDTAAVKKSVDAITIETHGYGINDKTWKLIEEAYRGPGIIVFTDPDHAGEQIRKRINDRFPGAKQAFLEKGDALKKGDIGIENASPESIRQALLKAHCEVGGDAGDVFSAEDMMKWGLTGIPEASERRRALGKKLGIGYANSRTFLQRLNKFGIERAAFEEAARDI